MEYVLPQVAEILVESFAVWRAVLSVPRAGHQSHMWRVPPINWQPIPLVWVGNLTTDDCNMSLRGLTCVPLHGDSHLLLYPGLKMLATGKVIFPLLSGRLLALEEALDWLQFIFTGERTEDYVSPASTFLVQYVMTEGGIIFAPVLDHLHWSFQGTLPLPPHCICLRLAPLSLISSIVQPLVRHPSAGISMRFPLLHQLVGHLSLGRRRILVETSHNV